MTTATASNGTILEVGKKYFLENRINPKWIQILDISEHNIEMWTMDNSTVKTVYSIEHDWLPYEPKEEPKLEETWTKTTDLRWYRVMNSKTLQQKHISNLGREDWFDVETVTI